MPTPTRYLPRFLVWTLVAGCLSSAIPLSAHAEPQRVFRAGAAIANINPVKFPVSVNGGMTDRQVDSVHDPLNARCLVLDDGRIKLAIVVCDSCMIPRAVMDSAKQQARATTGIPVDRMLISATHTHTAVTAGSVFQSDPDPEYLEHLARQVARGIDQAHRNLQPAEIGFGSADNDQQVFNRRWYLQPGKMPLNPFGNTDDQVKMNPGVMNPDLVRPAGPIDPAVSILSVRTTDGRPLALLANYSLHYVGGVPALSADYFGVFAERIGELLAEDKPSTHPPFVGMMSNGTSGDINNINFRAPAERRASFEQCRIVADSVAQTAMAAYRQIKHQRWLPLAMAERELELSVRRPTAAEIDTAKEQLVRAGGPPYKGLSDIYAHETVHLADYPATVQAKFQALRIGDLAITTTPCETFVEIGLALKKKNPLKQLFTIELANGYNGYLPTPEQFDLGGYETWRARSSYLARDSAAKIEAVLVELLTEVAR